MKKTAMSIVLVFVMILGGCTDAGPSDVAAYDVITRAETVVAGYHNTFVIMSDGSLWACAYNG